MRRAARHRVWKLPIDLYALGRRVLGGDVDGRLSVERVESANTYESER